MIYTSLLPRLLPSPIFLYHHIQLINPDLCRSRLVDLASFERLQLDTLAFLVHAAVRAGGVAEVCRTYGARNVPGARSGRVRVRDGDGGVAERAFDEVQELVEDGEFDLEFDGVDSAFVACLDVVYCAGVSIRSSLCVVR
jgi:hypothetical protein